MHVGRGLFFQNLDGARSDAEVVASEVALAVDAEDLGFQSLWLAEHHFSGYHMCPNPLQLLTYLAGTTREARLGTMVVVLPWHEPVRVAEDISMLDHLSGGRVLLGLGRGLGRTEFEGFRLDQGQSRQRFLEYATTLVNAFDSGFLECDGELYQQPKTALRPAPVAPLRGRTYASAVSPESMEIMARLGFGIMVIAQKPWETTVAEVATYRERFLEINGQEPPSPLLVSFVGVHESEQGAEEMHDRYHMRYARSCVDHYEFGNEALAEIPGYEYYGKLAEMVTKHGVDKFTAFLADLQVHGTPDQVVERLTENVRRLDGAGVVSILSFGDMPPEVAAANQELFTREVLPKLRAIDPVREIPDIRRGAVR